MKSFKINLEEYNYDLPDDRIAQHPVSERDLSKLLVYKGGKISENIFRNIEDYLPAESFLVFNNTRVIRARILFRKQTGASIEVLCLEPVSPSDYEQSFGSVEPVEWKCIVGNLKKWKTGLLKTDMKFKGKQYSLTAEKTGTEGEACRIRFSWNSPEISFAEVIESTGHIPLPPYIDREDEPEDNKRYQTVYSRINGSVAAPTAGLHFTDQVLERLKSRGIKSAEITLHVGAGTFKPIKTSSVRDHQMHCEHFFVSSETIEALIKNEAKIIAVGTTSVRTLESIYWLGVKILNSLNKIPETPGMASLLSVDQWEPYITESGISVQESLSAILKMMEKQNIKYFHASTSIMIVPSYQFRIVKGIITNFHQPGSTLLLLISAWTGEKWKEIYDYALENDFRFLSYGDSSLLLP